MTVFQVTSAIHEENPRKNALITLAVGYLPSLDISKVKWSWDTGKPRKITINFGGQLTTAQVTTVQTWANNHYPNIVTVTNN